MSMMPSAGVQRAAAKSWRSSNGTFRRASCGLRRYDSIKPGSRMASNRFAGPRSNDPTWRKPSSDSYSSYARRLAAAARRMSSRSSCCRTMAAFRPEAWKPGTDS